MMGTKERVFSPLSRNVSLEDLRWEMRRILLMIASAVMLVTMTATTAMAVNPDKQLEKCLEARRALENAETIKDREKAERKVIKYCFPVME
jgi:hypothetical protein